MSTTTERVTYATLAAGQTEDFKRRYDQAVASLRAGLGGRHALQIDGQEVHGSQSFDDLSPADTRERLGTFASASVAQVDAAVAAARRGSREWAARGWQERCAILRRAADLIEQRGFELSAVLSLEAGKTRLEAMGDVTETADLIRYYCAQMETHQGFDLPMQRFTPQEETRSVLRPYGVWAVISPFNFPAALAGGPVGAALVAGNSVVLKPSHETPLIGAELCRVLREAGVPGSALQLVQGPGQPTGHALAEHPGVDGLLFTGSKALGMALMQQFSRRWPKPCIAEMGGKNAAIVMASADLEAAAEGVARSAFGLQGQKCSACSRVYVHASVKERFAELLVERARKLVVGDPSQHGVDLGPLIHERAFATYERSAALAHKDGRVLFGGRSLRAGALAHGFFVAPTIVDGLPKEHALVTDELFVPLTCLAPVDSLDEALSLSNASEYGLTAGLFSQDEGEVQAFFERIEAGVVYVNRRAGATTGAWPGVQPFGGWKGSGTTGKASGGPYYVQQFMREQSRTRVRG